MACSREGTDYNFVTDTLINTFGTVLSRDVIYTIVESCSGDLNYAANAIMSITNESDTGDDSGWTEVQNSKHVSSRNSQEKTQNCEEYNCSSVSDSQAIPAPMEINATSQNVTTNATVNKISYAEASLQNNSTPSSLQSTNCPKETKRIYYNNIWTETIRRIVTYHNKGTRTLVFMRGAPGSGKSYLARQIVEITVGAGAEHLHIFSTDDFFMQGRFYSFNKMWLSEAHTWNKKRACEAMEKGVSPVIIDNTNVDNWEMEPYVSAGVNKGYAIEIVEPDTPWAKKLSALKARNTHNVPERSILRMLDALTKTITPETLLSDLKIVYPPNMRPPILRCIPEINSDNDNTLKHMDTETKEIEASTSIQDSSIVALNTDTQADVNVSSLSLIQNSFHNLNCQKQNEAHQDYHMFTDDTDYSTHNECQNINPEHVPQLQVEHEIDTNGSIKIDKMTDNIESNKNNVSSGEPFQSEYNSQYMQEVPTNQNQPSTIHMSPQEHEVNCNKMLEEFERVENEWENGEAWEEDINEVSSNSNIKSNVIVSTQAKPPREKKAHVKENTLPMFNDNDWRKITMFMPSFTENNNPPVELKQNTVETKSSETSMEIGDTDIYNNQYKVISAVSRDININYIPNLNEKVPKNPMLDKSSMTNEPTNIARQHRCKNEDKHFVRFRNMFKNLNKDDLRYIFDNCCGDVNWAVSIVLDDMATNNIEPIRPDEQSDTEDENEEPCECTAHYDIIPDITPTCTVDEEDETISVAVPSTSGISNNSTPTTVKKHKKETPLSDNSLALKRQIERNIVMSGDYYSINYVKARKQRYQQMYGNLDTTEEVDNNNPENVETIDIDVNTATSNQDNNTPSTMEDVDSDTDSDNDSGLINVEKTVNINIGYEFLGQLDKLFGRGDMVYSENIKPRINMPLSLLNEINALWMESLMYQLEAESKIHEEIIKQDEEFARELARKEEEVRESGKETEVPDLKEVMDLEFALKLYRKDCDEWQKDRPTDIAAKLSTQKLYNLFPEIPQRDLDEIHMAHHHDFQATVGVLLMSSGRSDMVEDENGINKFIMNGELQRQQKILNEEREKLENELDWPALPSRITLDVVNSYRNEAETHLKNRNMSFGKATDYMSRGMPMVASFYSDVARLHTLKYEQAQSIAAASLMQFHAERYNNSETLDLHYLRVAEARQALDIFLDAHIQHLRENIAKKNATLYFITGRGLHSIGGPKVKPAVKKRLRERNLGYCERNPGLLTVKICAGDKLSGQIT